MIDLTAMITPLNVLFLTVLLGYFIGKIKISHISLGLSVILFVAIVFGIIIKKTALGDSISYIDDFLLKMKTFSALGSAMFVSVIGINTGMSLKSNVKNNILSLAIGAFMAVAGVLTATVIEDLSNEVTQSTLFGVLCGALTSTPALSAVCENENIVASEAIVGYSCAYLFGVILVVLAVSRISSKSTPKEYKREESYLNDKKSGFCSFLLVCIVALLGNVIGSFEIPSTAFSLGNTGGILCAGTIAGYIFRKVTVSEKISVDFLECIRNIGLSLFFVGTGICAGTEMVKLNAITIIFGILITSVSLLCGFVLTAVFSKFGLKAASILAGGMTSSPALGVLTEKRNGLSVGQFSFSYFGALISLVLIINVIM